MPSKQHPNPHVPLICAELEANGVEIVGARDPDVRRLRFDLVHVHFPTHFLTESSAPLALVWALAFSGFYLLMKLLGKPIVYSIHDVVPLKPNNAWIVVAYTAVFNRCCNAYVFMNESSRTEFYRRYPSQRAKRVVMIPHGPYDVTLASPERRASLRRTIAGDSGAFVLGFVGAILPYKGLEAIRLLPRKLRDGRDVRVLVAGTASPAYRAAVHALLDEFPPGVVVHADERPNHAELDALIQAVDAVFLPYLRGWDSGMATLVLGNRRPLLGSELPMFGDLSRVVGRAWVERFGGASDGERASSLAEALERLAAAPPGPDDEARLAEYLKDCSFSRGCAKLRSLYGEVLVKRARAVVDSKSVELPKP